ncbi:hypothetical protein U6M95_12470, partial [Cutibacterium acnes]
QRFTHAHQAGRRLLDRAGEEAQRERRLAAGLGLEEKEIWVLVYKTLLFPFWAFGPKYQSD